MEAIEDKRQLEIDSSDEDVNMKELRPRRYLFKFYCCGEKIKVDNCLAARMVLATICLVFILTTFGLIMHKMWEEREKK